MTMPAPTLPQPALPPPEPPMMTLVISNPLVPVEKAAEQPQHRAMQCPHCRGQISVPAPAPAAAKEPDPFIWLLGKPHPFNPNMTIIRMFLDGPGVAVYSKTADDRDGIRDYIPISMIRSTQEVMPYDVLVEEIASAEAGEDEEEEPEDEPHDPFEPEPPPVAIAPPPNGQPSS